MYSIKNILHNLEQNPKKNILLLPFSTGFDTSICELGHNVFYVGNVDIGNCHLVDIQFVKNIPLSISIDLVIAPHNPQFINVINQLGLPNIIVQHTLNPNHTDLLSKVFVSPSIYKASQNTSGQIIPYSFKNSTYPKQKKTDILLIDYDNGYNLQHIIDVIPPQLNHKVVKIQGLTKADFDEARVFISTSSRSTITYETLNALDSECLFISNSYPALEGILKDKNNCLIINNSNDLIMAMNFIVDINNTTTVNTIANRGKELIDEHFSPKSFKDQWNKLIQQTCLIPILK